LAEQEIAQAVYSACPRVSRRQVKQLIDVILEEIVSTLVVVEDVKLRRLPEARAPRAQSEDGGRGADRRLRGCRLQRIGKAEGGSGRGMNFWFVTPVLSKTDSHGGFPNRLTLIRRGEREEDRKLRPL
jgi:hypothetical protein